MAATVNEESPKLAPGTFTEVEVISDVNPDIQEGSEDITDGSEVSEEEDSEAYDLDEEEEDDDDDDDAEHSNSEHESSPSHSQPDDDPFSDKYAKAGSSVCSYCEKLLIEVLKNNKESNDYTIPEHYESFWSMKKSSETCGLCWSLIEGTEEHLDFFPQLYPQDRGMQLRGYEICHGGYTMPFCDGEAIAGAGIHEFTLYIGGALDDPKFRFLLMVEDGAGT